MVFHCIIKFIHYNLSYSLFTHLSNFGSTLVGIDLEVLDKFDNEVFHFLFNKRQDVFFDLLIHPLQMLHNQRHNRLLYLLFDNWRQALLDILLDAFV